MTFCGRDGGNVGDIGDVLTQLSLSCEARCKTVLGEAGSRSAKRACSARSAQSMSDRFPLRRLADRNDVKREIRIYMRILQPVGRGFIDIAPLTTH